MHYYPKRVRLKRTANPGGILLNPLDLLQNPRPWFTTKTANATKPVKKTLILAEHSWNKRVNRYKFDDQLNDLRINGHRILF